MTKINNENCLERSLYMSSTKNNTQIWLVVSAFCFCKYLRVLEHKGRSCQLERRSSRSLFLALRSRFQFSWLTYDVTARQMSGKLGIPQALNRKKSFTYIVVLFLVLPQMKPMTKIKNENCLGRNLYMSSTKNNTQVWLVVNAFCFKKSLSVLENKGRSCQLERRSSRSLFLALRSRFQLSWLTYDATARQMSGKLGMSWVLFCL